MTGRERWLNGWPRTGNGVLIGAGVHCAGCGAFHGLTTVAVDEDWTPPSKMPDWPFEQGTCPVHNQPQQPPAPRDTLTERLIAMKERMDKR